MLLSPLVLEHLACDLLRGNVKQEMVVGLAIFLWMYFVATSSAAEEATGA